MTCASAIILWNTVYLEKAISKIQKQQNVPKYYLTYLSPLGWDHINLIGDYYGNLILILSVHERSNRGDTLITSSHKSKI